MSDGKSGASGGGIGFLGVLTIVFIVLKLLGHLQWSWVWVLSPLWIPLATVLVIAGIYGVLAVIVEMRRQRRREKP